MKILIAGDDVVLRRVLQSLLTKSKYEVELAENGEMALSALDLLAESLSSPDIAEVILLNKGVMLNLRYIHKLNELVQAGGKSLTVAVIEPSRLTRFFCSA